MRAEDFVIEVRDPDREPVASLSPDDMGDVLVAPAMRDVGVWQVVLPCTTRLASGKSVPHPVAELLRTPEYGVVVTGPGGVVLSGPTSRVRRRRDRADPGGTWTISGVSDAWILAADLAYGDPSTANLALQDTANDVRTDVAETLMHEYVSANIGQSAVFSRMWPGLVMGTDHGLGPVRTKSPRFQQILELLQEIATGTNILFDVVQAGTDLEFRTWDQGDRTADIRLDFDNGGIESADFEYSAPEVTELLVAGGGEGTARVIRRRTGNPGWGRGPVRFIDRRDTTDPTELDQTGDEALADAAAEQQAFQIVPDLTGRTYGVDLTVGDLVTVVEGDVEIPVPISTVPIRITSEGVTVGATVGSPIDTDSTDVLLRTQQRLAQRLAALERAL